MLRPMQFQLLYLNLMDGKNMQFNYFLPFKLILNSNFLCKIIKNMKLHHFSWLEVVSGG